MYKNTGAFVVCNAKNTLALRAPVKRLPETKNVAIGTATARTADTFDLSVFLRA